MKKVLSTRTLRTARPRVCEFCQKQRQPDYKSPEILLNFISDRGKIIGRSRSGLCAKHQRRLTKAAKRARFLAMIPFTQRVT